MKILFYSNIPSPYRVDFFNELGKYCELTVLFELGNSKERDKEWDNYKFINFKGIILNGLRLNTDTAFCPRITEYIKKVQYDYVVVTVLASPTALLFVRGLQKRGISYCYEGDGGFPGSVSGLKAKMKRYIISNAKLCFSTSKDFDKYCMQYGATEEKIRRYPFTSILEKDVLDKPIMPDEKKELRKKFGITEKLAIISVGSFIPRKGFDLLLEVARELPRDVGVYLVGGQPTQEYQNMKEQYNLEQVHFLDFKPKTELMEFYRAMDFFVLFTRLDIWGLVVNEAMASALPVVSTDRCIAATEMIVDNENGYMVESENLASMKEKVINLVNNPNLIEKMSECALRTAEKYTIENMTLEHMRVFGDERKIKR